MTLLTGLLVCLACFLLGLGAYLVWQNVPLYACPDCFSFEIDHFEAEGSTIHKCADCGRTWKDADEL
jgi:ribosomal protein L37AE/L43A